MVKGHACQADWARTGGPVLDLSGDWLAHFGAHDLLLQS